MKNKRITVVLLLATAALLFTSCAFKMNTEQKAHYEKCISSLENSAKNTALAPQVVKEWLNLANDEAAALNYRIEDKDPGASVEQGTKADALRKRFVPKKK